MILSWKQSRHNRCRESISLLTTYKGLWEKSTFIKDISIRKGTYSRKRATIRETFFSTWESYLHNEATFVFHTFPLICPQIASSTSRSTKAPSISLDLDGYISFNHLAAFRISYLCETPAYTYIIKFVFVFLPPSLCLPYVDLILGPAIEPKRVEDKIFPIPQPIFSSLILIMNLTGRYDHFHLINGEIQASSR